MPKSTSDRTDTSFGESLVVRGAREHNLQDVHVELPRDRLVVVTGFQRRFWICC